MENVFSNGKNPTFKVWSMVIFFFITDIWLLLISIFATIELIPTAENLDDIYINVLGWCISIPSVSFLLLLIWLIVWFKGLLDIGNRKEKYKDFTNTSYSDYSSWIALGFYSYLLFFIIITTTLIWYPLRFSTDAPRSWSDFSTEKSSRIWNITCLLLPAILSITCLVFQSVATWKYWALVWSCVALQKFKNPFFPEKTIKFHVIK
jgi:hypothetical protein